MEFKKVYIHLSTYKKLAKEYSKEGGSAKQQSPYSIVFSAHSGRLLVHKADRRITWPGAWYKFYGGVYPTYRNAKGVPVFSGVCWVDTKTNAIDSLMFTEGIHEDTGTFSEDVVCEIVLISDNVPEDISIMRSVMRT